MAEISGHVNGDVKVKPLALEKEGKPRGVTGLERDAATSGALPRQQSGNLQR